MIETLLCETLGIRYPIIQGGMAWIANADLASAVSNAGGLGLITAMNTDADWVSNEMERAKKLTDKPFGVNLMLMSPIAGEVAERIANARIKVVTTGAGNPGKYMEMWEKAGVKVLPVVASVALARKMERSGAAAIIAEGCESGGHIGESTTMALLPQVTSAVSIPVVAAGGIGDGRGLAAAMMLGASGAQMGTRFLVADECPIPEVYKEKILKAKDIDTMTTGRRLGHSVRSLKSPFSRGYLKKEYDSNVPDEELEALGTGALYRAAVQADEQTGCFMAGQIAGLVNKRQSAAEIVVEVCEEAEERLREATKWVR
ncbi:MAG: nitronate monooxygenase [Oscillospiraceae bacterium]